MSRRRFDHSPQLYGYTAGTIIAGTAVLAWSALTFPISEVISLTAGGGREGVLLGLVFWIGIGLLGGTKVERLQGHGVLTFHFPFIIAALALGGPTAGALVALISTIERRELRDMPWYGMLANHASLTVAAVAGGVTILATRMALAPLAPQEAQAVELMAIVAGSLVLALTATALAAGTVVLRDRLTVSEAVRVYDGGFRTTAAAEVVLGWMLWLTFVMIGWWASLICATFVLVMWNAHDAREIARHDAMTGLLSRAGFDARLTDALDGVRRRGRVAALLAIDLDGFKAINDTYGHDTGDDVIRTVGARLRAAVRLTDAAVRRGGDEFGVLLVDVDDKPTAETAARRIHRAICEPIELDDRTVDVGASVGVVVIAPSDRMPSVGRLHDRADRIMYQAKVTKVGVLMEGAAPAPTRPHGRLRAHDRRVH
jgi:diguanylate cyclase (GGDEF)-like protein